MLQNLDLDTVTFAQIASTGDPISIEDMNEQELQDLVLVNLARLVVSGEWTGLLEAGGGAPGLKQTPRRMEKRQLPVRWSKSRTSMSCSSGPSRRRRLAPCLHSE